MANEISSKEIEATILELHTLRLIEFHDDEHFTITKKGISQASEILATMSLRDKLLVILAGDVMFDEIFEDDELGDKDG